MGKRRSLQPVRAPEAGVVRAKGMETLTVRVSRSAHTALRVLAREMDESMTAVLDRAVELYRRQRFLDGLNADFAALQQDKAAWAEELAERAAWEGTLADGLED